MTNGDPGFLALSVALFPPPPLAFPLGTVFRARMKLVRLLSALLIAAVTFGTSPASAAGDPKEDLKTLVESINTKLKEGKTSAADLEPEIKRFDEVIAGYKDVVSEDVAQLHFMRAALYIQVFKDVDKAVALFKELQTKFPETESGKQVEKVLASIEQSKQRAKEQAEMEAKLGVGKMFPDFNEKDLNGEALSISRFKGKVVLVDFWATWCGPCISELPNVKAAYSKHRAAGFEIVGISLDQDRNKLKDFIAKHEMPWPQLFDGQGWDSKLGRQYGIRSIPATFLLDREGKVIARDLRGPALEAAVAKALAAK